MARILVVEDSPTVLSQIERLLQENGHEVVTVRDGLATLAALQAFVPDLMLLDIMLPGPGGIELCMMIRRTPRYASMPIIMVTALRTQASLARRAGAAGYVTKPFDQSDLIATVNQHLHANVSAPRMTALDANSGGGDYQQ